MNRGAESRTGERSTTTCTNESKGMFMSKKKKISGRNFMGCFQKPCVKVRGKSLNMYPIIGPGKETPLRVALIGEGEEDNKFHKHDNTDYARMPIGRLPQLSINVTKF